MTTERAPLVRLRVNAGVLSEWREDELASWSDLDVPDDRHVYALLGRERSFVVANDRRELDTLIASADYHGAGAWDPGDRVGFRRAIDRIHAALKLVRDAGAELRS